MAKRRELCATVVPQPGVKVHGPPVPVRRKRAAAPVAPERGEAPITSAPKVTEPPPPLVEVLRTVAAVGMASAPPGVLEDLEAWAGVARTGLEALELLRRRRR